MKIFYLKKVFTLTLLPLLLVSTFISIAVFDSKQSHTQAILNSNKINSLDNSKSNEKSLPVKNAEQAAKTNEINQLKNLNEQSPIVKAKQRNLLVADFANETEVEILDHFTVLHRENELFTTTATTHLTGFGNVTDISLSGFLPSQSNGNNIVISELKILDDLDQIIPYNVTYINYQTITPPFAVIRTESENNYALSDELLSTSSTNSLVVDEKYSTRNFGIEIHLITPSKIKNIQIAQKLPETIVNSIVLGEISVKTNDTVYVNQNFKNLSRIAASDENFSTFNIIVGDEIQTLFWKKFSTKGSANNSFIFMPIIDNDNLDYWKSKTVYYISDDENYKHLVPFIQGGKFRVQITDTYNTPDKLDDTIRFINYQTKVSEEAQLDFLKQITDTAFWETFLLPFGVLGRRIDKSNITVNDFKALNASTSNLIIALLVSGLDYSIEENSMSNMIAFSMLTSLTNIKFGSTRINTTQNFNYHFNIFIQTWLSELKALSYLTIPGYGPKSTDTSEMYINLVGNFNDAKWVSKLSRMKSLDLSAYKNYGDAIEKQISEAKWFSDYLATLIGFSSEFFITIVKNIQGTNDPSKEVKIVNAVITAYTNNSFTPAPSYYLIRVSKFIELDEIPKPLIQFDILKGWVSTTLKVNDSITIESFTKNSKQYWDFNSENNITPNLIVAYYTSRSTFVTQDYKLKLLNENSLINESYFLPISEEKRNQIEVESIDPAPEFETALNANNFNTLQKKIFIDEDEVSTVIYESRIVIDSDKLPSQKYYYSTSNAIHIFTSLEKISTTIPYDSWASFSINEIQNPITIRNEYNNYKTKGKISVPDPDKNKYPNDLNKISVNGEPYDEKNTFIYKSNLYWKFSEDIHIQDIKYFDGKSFYTELSTGMLWESKQVSEVKPHDPTPDSFFDYKKTPDQFELKDSNIDELDSATILIDDTIHKAVLYNGDSYWNYDLNTIKYVVVENGLDKYYTEFKPELFDSELYSIWEVKRKVPQIIPLIDPQNSGVIKTESGKIYSAILIAGNWKWLMEKTDFDNLKFVDQSGIYYSKIDSVSQVISKSMSTLFATWNEKFAEKTDDRQVLAQSFDIYDPTKNIDKGYHFDGQNQGYTIKDSKAYIKGNFFERINFITNGLEQKYVSNYVFIDQKNELKTSFSTVRKASFDLPNDYVGEDLATIADGVINAEIKDKSGLVFKTTIEAKIIESYTVFVFSNPDLASKIKYKGNNGKYFEDLKNTTREDGLISQIKPFQLVKLEADNEHLGVQDSQNKQLRETIAIAVIAGIFSLSIIAVTIKVIRTLKKRGK